MTAEPTPPQQHTVLDWAAIYAALGWRVLPIKPGEKRPPMTSWQHAASTDPKIHAGWWNGLYRSHGIGIATGRESGIFVLDVDTHGADGRATLAELEELHGKLPPTVTAITGSDGLHLFFAYPKLGDGWKIGTTKNIGDGLDVRGDGGQVVAHPTVHPNGTPYRWQPGSEPGAIPVADAPAWLCNLVAVPPTPAAAPPPTSSSQTDGESIAEHVRLTHRWADVLTLDGWRMEGTRGHDTYWTRPGKDSGTSAVLHGDGPFVVFTTSVPALQRSEARGEGDTWSYSMFGYIAATRFDGDRSATAREYRSRLNANDAVAATYHRAAQAHQALDEGESSPDDEWTPTSLAGIADAIRNGTHEPTVPTVLAVEGTHPLFYSGRISSLFGESGGGKTWVALAAVAEQARAGLLALMIDYEDSAHGIAERLVLLGLDDAEIARVAYLNPSTALTVGMGAIEALEGTWGVVVVDSTGEAMAAGGVEGNSDSEVAQWFVLVRRLTRLDGEPAVIVLDHVPKATDAPSSFAIGSQRKRAAVNGAAYRVDTVKEPAKGRSGVLKLTVAKDRLGNRAKGTTAAMVDIGSEADAVTIRCHLSDAQAAAMAGERFRPTVLMERLSRHLEENPGISKRQLLAEVRGKRDALETALEALVEEGWMKVERVAGKGGQALHYVTVRAFRDDANPVDNSARSESVYRGPSAAQPRPDTVAESVYRGPPPVGGPRYAGGEAAIETTESVAPVDNSAAPPDLDDELF